MWVFGIGESACPISGVERERERERERDAHANGESDSPVRDRKVKGDE